MRKKNYNLIDHEPVVGELRHGGELDKKYKNGAYIFSACEVCGKTRWVEYRNGKAKDSRCQKCVNKGRTFKLTHARTDIEAKEGDIRSGGELGMKFKEQKYIYESCPNCGNRRWVQVQTAGKYTKCRKCLRIGKIKEQNGKWKGGRNKNRFGYIEIRLQPDDKYYPMTRNSGYVLEHRLVMAQSLGRCLEEWEIVHHIDSIRDHNEISNLKLMGTEFHNTNIEKLLKQKDARIKELEVELAKRS